MHFKNCSKNMFISRVEEHITKICLLVELFAEKFHNIRDGLFFNVILSRYSSFEINLQ